MVEPITLAMLGGTALTEGIKFLYAQAGEILRRRRERKAGSPEAATPITVRDPGILAGSLAPLEIDERAADELADELKALRAQLSDYAEGIEDAAGADPSTVSAALALRDAIESVVGQRITFRGEQREPSGTPVVTGTIRAGEIRARAAGVDAGDATAGTIRGDVEADVIAEGADVAGVRLRNIGGRGG